MDKQLFDNDDEKNSKNFLNFGKIYDLVCQGSFCPIFPTFLSQSHWQKVSETTHGVPQDSPVRVYTELTKQVYGLVENWQGDLLRLVNGFFSLSLQMKDFRNLFLLTVNKCPNRFYQPSKPCPTPTYGPTPTYIPDPPSKHLQMIYFILFLVTLLLLIAVLSFFIFFSRKRNDKNRWSAKV